MDPTKRDIERELGKFSTRESSAGVKDYTVEWRGADPDARPTGIEFDPETGTLIYDAWKAQRRCLKALEKSGVDIVAFLAGFGGGKSVQGARWEIANALEYPGSHFLAMGQSFSKARDSTFKTLFSQLPGDRTTTRTESFNGPEHSPIVADYNRSENRITLVNDSVITLGSADQSSRYAGAEFGGIWLDEPSFYPELHELLEMLGSRLRGVEGPKKQFWTLTGNGFNDAWEILEKRQDSTGDPLGLNIEVIRASTLDNPYLDEGELERFQRQFAGTSREEQALHGGFEAAEGLVYSTFSRDTHVIPHAEAVEQCEDHWRIYGYDAGWNDPRVVLEIGKTDYEQLVVLDEFHKSESHVEAAITWLERENKPLGEIFAEHVPADIDEFRGAGYQTTEAEKSVDPGIDDVRYQLELDNQDRPGLLVSEKCRNLIQEFLSYKEEHVGKRRAVDHCLDALRYAVHSSGAGRGREHGRAGKNRPLTKPLVKGVKGGLLDSRSHNRR